MIKRELVRSGLPLYLDGSGVMTLGDGLVMAGAGHKTVADMGGLLARGEGADPGEWMYDTYRAIAYPADLPLFESREMCYDITIVAAGTVGGECKKTSGHYHGWNSARTNTYGEVYEVISGTALFCLQRSPDFEERPQAAHVDDVILVTVPEGETLIVPPNYGHCSVNIGDGPLVFSNVAYRPCPVLYDAVRARRGMAYYIFRDETDGLRVVRNESYGDIELPEPRYASVREAPDLGIDFARGAYHNFVEGPDRFDHLAHPDEYIERIMGLLDFGRS